MSICSTITRGKTERESIAPQGPCADEFKRAVTSGDVAAVQAMLERGSEVNHAYDLGLTPLHFAALHNHLEVVKVLLDHQADVSAVTKDGCFVTARAIAEMEGHKEVLEAILKASEGRPAPVTLHIYDLGSSTGTKLVNSVFRALGTGAFHAAVEVHGRELSFGYTEPDAPTGVFASPPRGCPMHTYRESVRMGETSLSETDVEALVEELSKDWPGPSYDLFKRNCCHFADAFCIRLGVGPIPRWVKSMAGAGAKLDLGVASFASKAGEVNNQLGFSETISMSAKYNLRRLRELDETISETVTMSMDYNSRRLSALRRNMSETLAASAENNARQLKAMDDKLKVSETLTMSADYNQRQIKGFMDWIFKG